MSKRNKGEPQKPEITKQADYYKLKTQAIEDLVTADESNSPEVSQEELRKYQSGPKLKVADWVKMLFVKAWFPGSVCFFFIWGLGGVLADQLDMLFVTGIALGVVTEMLTNNVLRFLEKTPGGNDRYMMFPRKGYITFPLNILYAFVVLFLVFMAYNVINLVIIQLTGAVDTVPLGVGPVLFGVFYLCFDMILIQGKHLVQDVVRGGQRKPR